jgi:hypothetical protein
MKWHELADDLRVVVLGTLADMRARGIADLGVELNRVSAEDQRNMDRGIGCITVSHLEVLPAKNDAPKKARGSDEQPQEQASGLTRLSRGCEPAGLRG